MAKSKKPIVIKKYRHRRLYRASDRTFTTLEELAKMAKSGEDFIVYNVETREDITRSVLTQIILEQAIKDGQNPLPLKVLRQLISFYGDNMKKLVPRYLEVSIEALAREQKKFRKQSRADKKKRRAGSHSSLRSVDCRAASTKCGPMRCHR
jgi:polyhydroxyalkanoate synthesis repressor PhaR